MLSHGVYGLQIPLLNYLPVLSKLEENLQGRNQIPHRELHKRRWLGGEDRHEIELLVEARDLLVLLVPDTPGRGGRSELVESGTAAATAATSAERGESKMATRLLPTRDLLELG
jgi:hypothetical protein